MSSVANLIDRLNAAAASVTLVLTFGSLIPGCIGLILNVWVFTRRSLRRHSCSIYFLASSGVNLFVMFVIIPVRIASNSFSRSLSDRNQFLCKIEYYLFFTARSLSIWFIVLVCIDRYIHSLGRHQWRQYLNSRIVTITAVISMSLLVLLAYCHMPIYYSLFITVNSNGVITNSFCASQRGFYRTFIALWHMTVYSLLPASCMLITGILTLFNIRQHRNRVNPMVNNSIQQASARRTDGQILRMLTVQVLAILLTTVPGQLFIFYQTLTMNEMKSNLRMAEERLMGQSFGGISYIAHASSFYLYTLTGTLFRKELTHILTKIICCSRNPRILQMMSGGTIQASEKTMKNTRSVLRLVDNGRQ